MPPRWFTENMKTRAGREALYSIFPPGGDMPIQDLQTLWLVWSQVEGKRPELRAVATSQEKAARYEKYAKDEARQLKSGKIRTWSDRVETDHMFAGGMRG